MSFSVIQAGVFSVSVKLSMPIKIPFIFLFLTLVLIIPALSQGPGIPQITFPSADINKQISTIDGPNGNKNGARAEDVPDIEGDNEVSVIFMQPVKDNRC